MRKTSQDGGDSTSATSGFENEIKKPKAGLLEFKSKKIGKRTAPNLSEESDDAVVEPLLQKTADKAQSAKYFAKAKADTVKEISKLFNDKKSQYASTSGFGTTETLLSEKDQATSKSTPSSNAPIHNYMNTNIFHSHDNSKPNTTTKSQILVEIDGSKQSGYNPSPLIFTTAKIHTDGKSKHMEPVQTTPGPILSTVEASVSKGGSITINEKKVSNGTSVMNSIYSQPHANENAKENTVNFTIKPPVTQKDNIVTDKNANPATLFTAKPNSPNSPMETHATINDKTKKSLSKLDIAPSKDGSSKTVDPSKHLTTLSNNPMDILSSPDTSKSTLVDGKNIPGATKDTKNTKMLVDEPRILMSESKLKSTISDNIKTTPSVTKSSFEPTKNDNDSKSSTKQPQISQSNKSDKSISEMNTVIDTKGTLPLQKKDVKSPTVSKELTSKPNSTSTKPSQQQTNKPAEIEVLAAKTDPLSSKTSESSKVPSAKTFSAKTPTQPKIIDSKLSKDIDKPPKISANDITKPNSKVSLNSTATSSTKIPISASVVKPATKITSPDVISSSITDTSNKAMINSSLSNSKAIASVVTTSTTTSVTPTAIKTQPSSIKTAISTANTKPTSAISIKTAKPSVSSIKSPHNVSTPTSATKQPNSFAAKPAGKPPPLAFTKTPPVATSSPSTAAPIAKSTVSKIAQVSTSHPAGSTSSVPSSSKATVDTSNKTKTPDLNKKAGSKPGDPAKDTKVSKA